MVFCGHHLFEGYWVSLIWFSLTPEYLSEQSCRILFSENSSGDRQLCSMPSKDCFGNRVLFIKNCTSSNFNELVTIIGMIISQQIDLGMITYYRRLVSPFLFPLLIFLFQILNISVMTSNQILSVYFLIRQIKWVYLLLSNIHFRLNLFFRNDQKASMGLILGALG